MSTPKDASPLAPCPFCGSRRLERDMVAFDRAYIVACWNCSAIGPEGQTREDADRLWNERGSRNV